MGTDVAGNRSIFDKEILKKKILSGASSWNLCLPAEFQVIGPVQTRPFSRVYRIDLEDCSIAVKLCLDSTCHRPNPRFATKQFETLVRCFDCMKTNARFRVPEPLALLADDGLILMQWVAGRSLNDVLGQRSGPLNVLLDYLTLSGAWLRSFHDAGPVRTMSIDAGELRRQIRDVHEDLVRQEIEFRNLEIALLTLEKYIPMLSGSSLEKSWLHPDFQPGNIIFSTDATFGLDIALSLEGVIFADAAHFLNHIGRFPLLPTGLHLLTARQKLAMAFLDGFTKEDGAINLVALNWFRVLDDVRFLVRHYRSVKSVFHRWYLAQVQNRTISESLKRLQSLAPVV